MQRPMQGEKVVAPWIKVSAVAAFFKKKNLNSLYWSRTWNKNGHCEYSVKFGKFWCMNPSMETSSHSCQRIYSLHPTPFVMFSTWHLPLLLLLLLSRFSRVRLCDPTDGSPWGSPIPGILQARILERVAISFSSAWKRKVKGKLLSRVRLLATPWTVAHQAPPSMASSKEHESVIFIIPRSLGSTVFTFLAIINSQSGEKV